MEERERERKRQADEHHDLVSELSIARHLAFSSEFQKCKDTD